MKSRIRAYAQSLGFDAVGFVSSKDLDHHKDSLLKKVQHQSYSDLAYLRNFEIRHQKLLSDLPACRSAVVVGMNSYAPRKNKTGDLGPQGNIARYAWGEDYHRVIGSKLERLQEFMTGLFPEAAFKICVDKEPVVEKALASRAGLGFQGKNTLLIHPIYGPWLLLGVLLTTIELETDGPILDDCGECDACVRACPTHALKGDRTMEADRCIAFHTAESRRPIPAEIEARMTDQLYGCEICLEACPYTKKTPPHQHEEFRSEHGIGEGLSLSFIASMRSNREYEKYFSASAMKRLGLKKMKQTAEILAKKH